MYIIDAVVRCGIALRSVVLCRTSCRVARKRIVLLMSRFMAMRSCAPLRSAALRCAPLRSAALRCAPLRSAALRCAPLRSAALRCAPLRSAALRCAPLCSAVLRCAPLCSAVLRCASAHLHQPLRKVDTIIRPIFLLRLSLLRFVDSVFPGDSLWT